MVPYRAPAVRGAPHQAKSENVQRHAMPSFCLGKGPHEKATTGAQGRKPEQVNVSQGKVLDCHSSSSTRQQERL